RRHTSFSRDWSSVVCSSDLAAPLFFGIPHRSSCPILLLCFLCSGPIFHTALHFLSPIRRQTLPYFCEWFPYLQAVKVSRPVRGRSEERRVGKELRSNRLSVH